MGMETTENMSREATVPLDVNESELTEIMASLTQMQSDAQVEQARVYRIEKLLKKVDKAMMDLRSRQIQNPGLGNIREI